MKPRPRDLCLTEFIVEVRTNKIDWGGLDTFLCKLLQAKPEEGFSSLIKECYRPRRTKKHRGE